MTKSKALKWTGFGISAVGGALMSSKNPLAVALGALLTIGGTVLTDIGEGKKLTWKSELKSVGINLAISAGMAIGGYALGVAAKAAFAAKTAGTAAQAGATAAKGGVAVAEGAQAGATAVKIGVGTAKGAVREGAEAASEIGARSSLTGVSSTIERGGVGIAEGGGGASRATTTEIVQTVPVGVQPATSSSISTTVKMTKQQQQQGMEMLKDLKRRQNYLLKLREKGHLQFEEHPIPEYTHDGKIFTRSTNPLTYTTLVPIREDLVYTRYIFQHVENETFMAKQKLRAFNKFLEQFNGQEYAYWEKMWNEMVASDGGSWVPTPMF